MPTRNMIAQYLAAIAANCEPCTLVSGTWEKNVQHGYTFRIRHVHVLKCYLIRHKAKPTYVTPTQCVYSAPGPADTEVVPTTALCPSLKCMDISGEVTTIQHSAGSKREYKMFTT